MKRIKEKGLTIRNDAKRNKNRTSNESPSSRSNLKVSSDDLDYGENRLRKQNEVLVRLATSRAMEEGDLDSTLKEITESSAETLGVERVNIWLYNDDKSKILCVDHFVNSTKQHDSGFELCAADYPSYFSALEKERIIAAREADSDPRTREFSKTYLKPNGITSLLDAPIRKGGNMIGLVCHEHIGAPHEWTLEEQHFAASIADFVSLAIESRDRRVAEVELEGSISLLRATLDSTADGILVVRLDGRIVSFNEKFLEMWNIPRAIIESRDDKKTLDYVLEQLIDPPSFINKVDELYDKPDSESYDVLGFKDGRVFERFSKPQKIGENTVGRVWSFRDVTTRTRAEQALRESEERYRTLVEHSYDLISEAGVDGRFLYVSANHKEILGYDPAELEGENLFENIHPDERETVMNEFKRIMETLTSGHVVLRFKHKDGKWRWIESAGKPYKTAKGEVRAVIASRDITDKKIAEDKLKESLSLLSRKSKYETIISSVTRSVHQSIDLQDVLQNAVDSMSENIGGAENVGIWLIEGSEAVLMAYKGFPDWFVTRVSRIPYPRGVTWKSIEEDKPIYSPNATKDKAIGPAGLELGTKSYLSMPVHFDGNTVGVININSLEENAFENEDLNLLEIVAQQIEVAIKNAKQAEALRQSGEALRKSLDQLSKKNRYEMIISTVTRGVHQSTNLNEVMDNAVQSISENIDRADSVAIYIVEGEEAVLKAQRGYSEWYIGRVGRIPYPKGYAWKVIMDEKPRYCPDVDQDTVIGPAGRKFGIKSYLSMPILYEGKTIGVININSKQISAFDKDELKLLEIVREQITVALNNARQKGALQEAITEVEILKNRLKTEHDYLDGGFQSEQVFKEIVGRNILLQKALFRLHQLASTDSTILIRGEPGSGKELFARSVHDISDRGNGPYIKVNCSELPEELMEIELFGHEAKGSVTGALSLRLGSLELANYGTIYLKEIGDIPLELQSRLLRVIQDGKFTRGANNLPISVDVKLIASSRYDLSELVSQGNFMENLYDQLIGFQVNIPPLRERKDDIPWLVQHFISFHGPKLGKKVDTISNEAIEYLKAYDWPGNVSQLEEMTEKAIEHSRANSIEKKDLIGLV